MTPSGGAGAVDTALFVGSTHCHGLTSSALPPVVTATHDGVRGGAYHDKYRDDNEDDNDDDDVYKR